MTLPPEPMAKIIRTLSCRTVTQSGSWHTNHIRDLTPFLVEERSGAFERSEIATPPETLLAALGSCLGARISANAAAADIKVTSLELHVDGDIAISPAWEPPGITPRSLGFNSIRVAVHMDAEASPDAIRALIAHAVLWSPVANTLHNPVHLDVTVAALP